MKHTKVIIVGGGLAGLYSAYLLEQQRIPYLLLEAQPRMGGRILGTQSNPNSGHYFDLGPTWIFPHQQRIQHLVKQLGISLFEQYSAGDVLYQSDAQQKPRQINAAGDLHLFKIKGGSHKLISALNHSLSQRQVLLEHKLMNIEKKADLWHLSVVHNNIEQKFSCDNLMLAMPPRIIANYLTNKQWLSNSLVADLRNSQTWMAGQAKFLATYTRPFWRERGLSGQLFSQSGPMVEVHDASTDSDSNFGLFGFIGWPASRRNQISEQQLKDACLSQLACCFGAEAYDFDTSFFKDWATDKFTCTDTDRQEASRHPDFTLGKHLEELHPLSLHLVGSEFAIHDPGYLEGAIDAVDRSASILCG